MIKTQPAHGNYHPSFAEDMSTGLQELSSYSYTSAWFYLRRSILVTLDNTNRRNNGVSCSSSIVIAALRRSMLINYCISSSSHSLLPTVNKIIAIYRAHQGMAKLPHPTPLQWPMLSSKIRWLHKGDNQNPRIIMEHKQNQLVLMGPSGIIKNCTLNIIYILRKLAKGLYS